MMHVYLLRFHIGFFQGGILRKIVKKVKAIPLTHVLFPFSFVFDILKTIENRKKFRSIYNLYP
jgi:hypothetical protein